MRLNPFPPAAEWRDFARRRYVRRTLLCSLTEGRAPDPSRVLQATSEGRIDLYASGPVEPGRPLLVQLPSQGAASPRTFLAYVASADSRDDGSWLVRCVFASRAE